MENRKQLLSKLKALNPTEGEWIFDGIDNLWIGNEIYAMMHKTSADDIDLITLAPSMREELIKMEEAFNIVKELAEWSMKYPRGRVYPMSKLTMDDELVKLEEKAKQFINQLNQPQP